MGLGTIRRPTLLLLTVAALALTAVPAAGAAIAAAPAWRKPEAVGPGGTGPRAVLTGGGGAVAVWEDPNADPFDVEAAVHAGGGWRAPKVLARQALEPALAAGPGGSAVAVWDSTRGVEGAWVDATGTWSKPTRAPRSGGFALSAPEVAVDSSGAATVVWRQPAHGDIAIASAVLRANGHWSKPERLSTADGTAFSPQVAVDPAGAAVAVWRHQLPGRGPASRSVVQAASRGRAGGWTRPVTVSEPGENAVEPRVAISAGHEAVVVWHRFDGDHQIAQAASHRSGRRWSRPADLSARGRNAEEPQVAISPAGEPVVAWERSDGRATRIQAASRRGGSWSAPRPISSGPRSAHEPRLAFGPEGLLRVTWIASGAGGPTVVAAARTTAGHWVEPVTISAGRGSRDSPWIAAGGGGEAVAIWGGELAAAFFG